MNCVLIVDDEPGFREVLEIVLARAGFMTLTAPNAAEAQSLLARSAVHLIILDDMMPGMSGTELCLQLKADPRTHAIPILMHSAHERLHQPGYAERIGADGVLLKPCPPREIVARVQSFFAANAAQHAG
ncbi:MAG TPA: response regulator [Candidatus Limnocylindrales bacterium]|nr:response regulator [Candidatus Limnocylindrales bacterium]